MTTRVKSPPKDELYGYLNGNLRALEDPRRTRRPEVLATIRQACAIFGYGYGLPIAEVKAHIGKAVDAEVTVQRARPSLEVLSTPVEGEYPDYWHAASNYTLQYLYWALVLGDAERARELASAIWDPEPPAIPKIFPIFRIAYAVRDVVLGKNDAALAELARIGTDCTTAEKLEARVVEALAREDRASIVKNLNELARGHRRATAQEPLVELRILSVPAAGLASLALDRGLVTPAELPQGVDAFPGELVVDGRA